MNVLLTGGGGREHAIAWALSASPLITRLFAAPGNPGIAEHATIVDVDPGDHAAVVTFCTKEKIDLVVIGPDAHVVAGLADAVTAAGVKCFGPSKAAARLEGSKGFTKDLCTRVGIPTAAYARFSDPVAAKSYIAAHPTPIVVKADGLALGKGVVIAGTRDEAALAIDTMFAGAFGEAGTSIVVEEFLIGEEASFFALCDGVTAIPLASAQDHKRVGEGDTGPNTGGMGAYSPAPVMTPEITRRVMAEIVEPTLKAMREDGAPYVGVLFAGLMITADGPKLIEYNCRFGDPETQVLLPRLKDDLLALLLGACDGQLRRMSARWREEAALTVVFAAKGYPGTPARGGEIQGLAALKGRPGLEVFQAGTALKDGKLVANGGRVLNVTAIASSLAEARAKAYQAVDAIDWADGFCRRDIGWRALARDQKP